MNKKVLIPILLVFTICSCETNVSGEWKSVVASNKDIVSTSNVNVNPFNTVMQLGYFLNDDFADTNEETFNNVSNIYNNSVAKLHKLFDRHYYYLDDNENLITNIKTINQSYGTNTPIKCEKELYSLLKLGVECYELTNGQFNIFTGQITDFWDNAFAMAYDYVELKDFDPYFNVQKKQELERLVDSIPCNIEEVHKQLTFDDDNMTVTFNECDFNNGIKTVISMGGIAKGYATDLLKKELLENGYKDGYLMSGGSSITTLSTPIYTSKEKGHKISVINPAKSNMISKEAAFSMRFVDEFNFSTSGNYTDNKNYKFYDDDNNLIYRHHIINPFTGFPESFYRSVSITTSYFSNAQVDALSTAFMNLSIEDGMKLRESILNKYEGSNLEVFYLSQVGLDNEALVTVTATGNVNDTLSVAKGVKLVYES